MFAVSQLITYLPGCFNFWLSQIGWNRNYRLSQKSIGKFKTQIWYLKTSFIQRRGELQPQETVLKKSTILCLNEPDCVLIKSDFFLSGTYMSTFKNKGACSKYNDLT